jgi:preprotein translocase subunit SecF
MSRRERKLLRRQGKQYKPDNTIEEKQETATRVEHRKKDERWIAKFYEKYDRKAMWFTIALLIISLIIIGVHTATTGEFIPRGVSLKGGTTITVPFTDAFNVDNIQNNLRGAFPQASISVREMSSAGRTIGFIVDASDVDPQTLLDEIKAEVGNVDKISVETMGSSLGQSFFKQVIMAMIVAFVLMSIVVFLSFKTFVPSGAVILSAFSDIVMTIAVIDIFGIKVETAGIAALLMLIGYSVDTDVLLTTRVLKREEGTVMDRIIGAMKTGMTMTLTAIAAVVVAYLITESETLKQIMLILFIGLIFDMMNTWIQNAGILLIYVERRAKKHAAATLADYKEKEEEFEEVVDLDEEAEEKVEEKKPVVHPHTAHEPHHAAQQPAQTPAAHQHEPHTHHTHEEEKK